MPYPKWVIVDLRFQDSLGATESVHTVQDLPRVYLPVFTSERLANEHAADMNLTDYELREIPDVNDMVMHIEYFRGKEGTHVCFDQYFTGRNIVAFTIDESLSQV